MLEENLRFLAAGELPGDWQQEVVALAAGHALDVPQIVREIGEVEVTLRSTASLETGIEAFGAAIKEASQEIRNYFDRQPPHQYQYQYRKRLAHAAAELAAGRDYPITGRQLLAWFGASRRGSRVVDWIRSELEHHGLVTEPDFNEPWVDVTIWLKRKPPAESPAPPSEEAPGFRQDPDPAYRIGRLEAANRPVVTVRPGSSLKAALTEMVLQNFSQLPVMNGERDCKGAVTWRSVGKALALGREVELVDHCIEKVFEVTADTNLFDALPSIVREGFVLVKGHDRKLQGIVTSSDLSLQFRDWTEPFLLLGQVEHLLRGLVHRSFTLEELRAAKNPADAPRLIQGVEGLSFGEYVRLLEPEVVWSKLGVAFARGPFLKALQATHVIRNEVMHFDPDPLDPEQLTLLRNFASFLDESLRGARVASP